MSADTKLQKVWYGREPLWLFALLIPLALVFAFIVRARRFAYDRGWFAAVRLSRPVIVVGNITVGGTGKTPFTIWLAQRLQAKGWRVGIVLRGYGGQSATWPREVNADTPYAEVGDEAVMLALRTRAIVVADPDRVTAARRAIELGADFVISDDGLQHYRLARDAEIAVVDEQRGAGNGWLLPAGPLREPKSRLKSVDLIVRTRRSEPQAAAASLESEPHTGPPDVVAMTRVTETVSLVDGSTRSLSSFQDAPVHAVAGIGNPDAFFGSLRAAGLTVDSRALPDHAALTRADIDFDDDAPVLMTQKDAVKCRGIATGRHWAVVLDLELDEAGATTVDLIVKRLLHPAAMRP